MDEAGRYPEKPKPLAEVEGWYLDSEGSLICEDCAKESNHLDEVPQFRPVTPVTTLTEDETCDHCSREPEPWEVVNE